MWLCDNYCIKTVGEEEMMRLLKPLLAWTSAADDMTRFLGRGGNRLKGRLMKGSKLKGRMIKGSSNKKALILGKFANKR